MKAILLCLFCGAMLEQCSMDILSAIKPGFELSRGDCGTVYMKPGAKTVFKVIPFNEGQDEKQQFREIDFMKQLNGMMLEQEEITVKYFSDCTALLEETNYRVIEMEQCQETFETIIDNANFDVDKILGILRKMARIIKALNDKFYFHFDAHFDNFMMCNGHIKIIDFGFMEKFEADTPELEEYREIETQDFYESLNDLFYRCFSIANGQKPTEYAIKEAKKLFTRMNEMRNKKYQANQAFFIEDVISFLNEKFVVI